MKSNEIPSPACTIVCKCQAGLVIENRRGLLSKRRKREDANFHLTFFLFQSKMRVTNSCKEPILQKSTITKDRSKSTRILVSAPKIDVIVSPQTICPPIPPALVGRLKVSEEVFEMDFIEASVGVRHSTSRTISWNIECFLFSEQRGLTAGGRYSPRECIARHKVAILLPYRNRKAQLAIFLHHMHPILKRQQLDYGIYVVNQVSWASSS